MTVSAGDRAPDFTVETTEGSRSLGDFLADGPLVLVFYSEDSTPTCTTQVSSFRDEYATLRDLGANVLAVSADTIESHQRFAERLEGVPFPLGADPDLELARAYDVVDDEGKRSRRAVFVIGRDGIVTEAVQHYQPGVMDQFASVFRALGVDL
jgi:peroxiredoxin Q/BCP